MLFWASLLLGERLFLWAGRDATRWWVIAGLMGLAGLVAVFLVGAGVIDPWWRRFRYTDGWAAGRVDRVTFYHGRLMALYPTLWSLFPVLALVAAARRSRPAVFAASVFGVALLAHSAAAQKSIRYLYYVMPAFFAVSGIALTAAVSALRDRTTSWLGRLRGLGSAPRARRLAGSALVVAALAFVVGANPAYVHAVRMVVVPGGQAYGEQPDWPEAGERFRDDAANSTAVLSSAPIQARYYLGRLDVSLYAGDLMTREGKLPEFTRDPWLNRPVVAEPESLARILDCLSTGLVLIAEDQFADPWYVSTEMAELLESRTEPVAVPQDWKLRVFRWSHRPASIPECASIPLSATSSRSFPHSDRPA